MRLALCVVTILAAAPALAQSGQDHPVVFGAFTNPGPTTNSNARTGSFNFSTPNGDVDLNRPGGAVLATPGTPPVFFIAPPGAIQTMGAGQGSDKLLN